MTAEVEASLAEYHANHPGKEIAKWWEKHFTKAGHKRLGRILLKLAKV